MVSSSSLGYGLSEEFNEEATHLVVKGNNHYEDGVYAVANKRNELGVVKEREDTAFYLINRDVEVEFVNSLNLRERMDINETKGKFKIELKGETYIFNIIGGKLDKGQLVQFDEVVFKVADIVKPEEKGGKKVVVPQFLDVTVLEPVHVVRKMVTNEKRESFTYIAGVYKDYVDFGLASSGYMVERVFKNNLLPVITTYLEEQKQWGSKTAYNLKVEINYNSKGDMFERPMKYVVPYVTTNVTDRYDGLVFATEENNPNWYEFEKEEIPNYFEDKTPIIVAKIAQVLGVNYKYKRMGYIV